jgi:hypothetical protein
MLECKDCGTRKIYPARTFDGKLCLKCNGRLFLPIRFLNHKKRNGRDNMKPQRLKDCIKTEDETKGLIHEAGEKMDELSKILDAINNAINKNKTEIKITTEFPAKRGGITCLQ